MSVALIVAALVVTTAAPPVAGFSLEVHEVILKDALADGNTLSDEALKLVTGSFFGGGNLGSDRHQLSAERHFDGAKSPTDICALWKRGLNAALERAVQLTAPGGNEKRSLKDREEALKAFGQATHAIADFYSHTNWIELHAKDYRQNPRSIPQAPILNQTCDPAAFPGIYRAATSASATERTAVRRAGRRRVSGIATPRSQRMSPPKAMVKTRQNRR